MRPIFNNDVGLVKIPQQSCNPADDRDINSRTFIVTIAMGIFVTEVDVFVAKDSCIRYESLHSPILECSKNFCSFDIFFSIAGKKKKSQTESVYVEVSEWAEMTVSDAFVNLCSFCLFTVR